jgi:hypothetical protein
MGTWQSASWRTITASNARKKASDATISASLGWQIGKINGAKIQTERAIRPFRPNQVKPQRLIDCGFFGLRSHILNRPPSIIDSAPASQSQNRWVPNENSAPPLYGE